MKVGIVGLPNVGKSTLFNVLTNMNILEANYPFATIEPNVGIVPIQDKRLNHLASLFQSQKIIPTQIEFIDIAGLVEGASKGEGLGNKFLGHIRNVDTICHVVKCFEDPNIMHVRSHINPIEESNIIETELILSDLEQIEKRLAKINKQKKAKNDKEALQEQELLTRIKEHLENEKPVTELQFTPEEQLIIKNFNLLSLKPMMYIGNFHEKDLKDLDQNPFFQAMMTYSQNKHRQFVPLSILLEKELATLEEADRQSFLQEYNLKESALQNVIQQSYQLLGLETYFTTGKDETKAWSFVKGSTAPQCARLIHTDFERGFIRAEVYNYQDIQTLKSLTKIKENGKLRLEGKNYLVQDGDIIVFHFNV
ncbi:MAG: redox-regulated ATPase YchF [Lettuce witches'-broom phytoplasma]